MKTKFTTALITISLLLPMSAAADTIVGTAGYDWQSWSASDITGTAGLNHYPYFDVKSWDGQRKAAGYYLTNTGYFTGGTAGPGAIDYWGSASGADPNFYFVNDSDYSDIEMHLEITEYINLNSFGWYDVNNPTLRYEILSGPDNPTFTTTFYPTGEYGFYLINGQGQLFLTQSGSSLDQDPSNLQHFAVFQESATTYWLGVEDLGGTIISGKTDADYNDLLVKITNVNIVPEPGGMLLLGSGLLGFWLIGRRRKH